MKKKIKIASINLFLSIMYIIGTWDKELLKRKVNSRLMLLI
jgi:hypothetical protein